jgi:hypothetical protein
MVALEMLLLMHLVEAAELVVLAEMHLQLAA